MAGATRRSEAVCQRIGFNPLKNKHCCGMSDNIESCNKEISHHFREVAYYMIGQGEHLSASSSELKEILSEAADLLYCCESHIRSDSLVGGWVKNWARGDGNDYNHCSIIDDGVEKWIISSKDAPIPLKQVDGRVMQSDFILPESSAHKAKVQNQDCRLRAVYSHPKRTRSEPSNILHDLSRPVPLHLNSSRKRENGTPCAPLSPLPTVPEGAEANPSHGQYFDRTIGGSGSRPMTQSIQPTAGSSTNATETLTEGSSESAPCLPTTAEASARRKMSLSMVGNAFLRAVTQQLSPATTPPADGEAGCSAVKMTPRREPPPFSRTTEPTAIEPPVPSSSTITRPPRAMRPRLTLRTTFSTVQEPSRPSRSAPVVESTPHSGIADLFSALPVVDKFLKSQAMRTAEQERTECEICTLEFNARSELETWTCPQCDARVHMQCFKDWNHQSVRTFRSTTCPYCRFVVRRPANIV